MSPTDPTRTPERPGHIDRWRLSTPRSRRVGLWLVLLHQRARFTPVWRAVLVVTLVVIAVTVTEVVGHTLHELYEGWVLTTVNFLVVVAFLAALSFKRVC